MAGKQPRSDGHAPSLPFQLECPLSPSRHFPFFFSCHTSSTRGTLSLFLELPGGEHGEGKTPFLASLCLCLYKSSGFVQFRSQVWALTPRCEVISVMRTQECALSDFPSWILFFLAALQTKAEVLPRGSQTQVSRDNISWVLVGFTGACLAHVDTGPVPNGVCRRRFSDPKQSPSSDRGHPALLREGNEAIACCNLGVKNTNLLCQSRQGGKKFSWELRYNLCMCTNRPANRFPSGLFQMGRFLCWISFEKKELFLCWGGRGPAGGSTSGM